MQFCDCGGMLVPKEGEMACRKCGKRYPKQKNVVKTEIKAVREEVIEVDSEKQKSKISTIEETCPKCGNKEAAWWMQQTRGVDEPATRFFRCMKCGHTWREYA